MMTMIAQYDFQSAIDKAVEEELLRLQYNDNQKTIEELISQLSLAMKDQQRIVQLWPTAPGNHEMFSHLELSFDLAEGKVTTETAAKDASGEPYHKHVLDLATDSSISLTGSEVTHYKPAGETLAPVATAAPAPAPVQQIVQKPVQQPVQQVAPAPTPAPEAYDWTNPNEWKKFLKPDELAAVNAREAAEWQTANGAVANQW
jgi:hypothetical protein